MLGPSAPPRRFARRVVRGVTLAVGIGCAVFFLREVATRWDSVTALSWSPSALLGLGAALVTLVVAGVIDAWTWGWLLRALGVSASSRVAMAVFCQAQFAKYLPGNVGQHVGRLELSRRAHFQLGRVALSMVIENGLAIGSGALFAGFGLLMLGTAGADARLPLVALALVTGTVIAAAVIRSLLARPPALLKRLLHIEQPLELRWSFVAGLFLSHLFSHLASALAVAWLLVASGAAVPDWLWRVPAVATVGWLSGYLLPGAPAGLGVREIVVTRLLAPYTGEGVAISAALSWRLAALGTDALLLATGVLLRQSEDSPEVPKEPEA